MQTTIELKDEPPASALRAKKLADELALEMSGLSIPASLRTRLAAGCQFTSMEHHVGIALLFTVGHPAPALALLRPVFESYIRGVWLSDCAIEAELDKFKDGVWRETPSIKSMIKLLETTETFNAGILSASLKANWEAMCGYTHSGVEQVKIATTGNSIERNCTPQQIDEAIQFACACAIMAALAIAALAEDGEVAGRLYELAKGYVANEDLTRSPETAHPSSAC